MFPKEIRVENPALMPLPPTWEQYWSQYTGGQRYWVTLNKEELSDLWQGLFDLNVGDGVTGFCDQKWAADPNADLSTVSDWICGRPSKRSPATTPDALPAIWKKLKQSLSK